MPIDGSENALAAVRHVIKLIQDREPLEVHLLNVQPPFHGDVTSFVSRDTVKGYYHDEAGKALKAACELLDASEIPYTKHVHVGHAADMIAACARELRCHKVIMGTHGRGTVTQLLMGSVTHKAIHQMDPHIPVTLVKEGYGMVRGKQHAASAVRGSEDQ